MLKDFKQFLLKGNLVALAVAFVMGLAFSAVITALVANLITPLIAAIGGNPDFAGLTFTVNGSVFRYGLFLNALITFVLVAAVLFFLVVRPYNSLEKRFARGEDDDIEAPEYAVETGSATSMAGLLNARAADGWKVVSVGDSSDGGLAAVLVRGEE